MTAAHLDRRDWLTTKQAADAAGVSLRTIQLWCDDLKISHQITPGGHRRISRGSMATFVAAMTVGGVETRQQAIVAAAERFARLAAEAQRRFNAGDLAGAEDALRERSAAEAALIAAVDPAASVAQVS